MKVAIIGAAGRMGGWFTRYFTEKGVETTVYDIDQRGLERVAETYGARRADDLTASIIDADVVIVSVPIPVTAKVISEVSQGVKQNAFVVEITSFKKNILPHLKRAGREDVTPLSIHPMFGHGAKSLSGHRIVVVPVRSVEEEVAAVREIFPEAEVISATAEEHDVAMATVLSLTHFVNFIFASTLPKGDIEKVRRLSGTSFNLQLTLAEAILHDDPEFLATLQIDNKYASGYIKRLVKEAEALGEIVAKKNRKELITRLRSLKSKMKNDRHYSQAYQKMYEIMSVLLGSRLT